MADAEITIKDETEGVGTANVDTKSLIGVGGKIVNRQVAVIGSPATFGQVAEVNANSELLVKHTDAIPVTDNAGSLTIDGSVAILAGTNNIGDVDILTIAAGANRIGKITIRNSADAADIDPLAESTFTTRINTQGQKTMASSTPVVIASDQTVIPVSDNAGSITVDAPVGTPVASRLSDGTAFLTTTSGRLSVDASGVAVPVTDNSGSITVDQATATNLKAEVVGISSDNSANTTTKQAVIPARANASDPAWTEGNQVPLSTDLTGNQRCAVGKWLGSTAPTVGQKTMANSLPVVIASDQSNVAVSQATASSLNAQTVGSVAHDGVDAGNPVKVGGQARQTNPTAVADADRVNAIFDDLGRLVVIMDQVRDLVNDQTTTISTTTETTIFTAVASVFNDLVMLTIANTSATATRIDFRDTTGGAVRFSLYCPAGATIGFVPKVPIKQATVNTNWTAQLGTAVTDVRIFAQVVRNV